MVQDHQDILAPSILAGDHGSLLASAKLVEELGLKWLHVDIMDGHFVPNLTFGPATVATLCRATGLFLDVHLMLDNPHRFVEPFVNAGADLITVHIEPDYPVAETLAKIRGMDCLAGLAINPDTPAEAVLPHIESVDLILIMTVQPGFGGQSFRHEILPKIAKVAEWRRGNGLRFRLEVDGGINEDNAALCRAAGADTFVAGTSFFAAPDKEAYLRAFPGMPGGL